MNNGKIKIAIIGLGNMGQKHYNAAVNNPDVEIVALVEPKGFKDKETYKNVQDMLKKQIPQCAIISTPTKQHLTAAAPLIKKGIHVMIEKPLVRYEEEVSYICDLADTHQVRIAVGHVERFNPAIQTLKRDIKNDNIIDCYSKRVGPRPRRVSDVGVSLDLAVHDIDLVRFITGKNILDCVGRKRYLHDSKREDNINISINLEGLISSTVNASWTYPFRERTMKVLTKQSFYDVDMMNMTVRKYQRIDDSKYSVENLYINKEDALQNQLNSFLRYAIMKENNDIATLADGVESMRAALEAIK